MKMKTGMMGLALSLTAASVLALTGCGSSSSSSTPEAVAYNGVLVDSGVAGVTFECGTVTGTTRAPDGFFGTCPAGSIVTFSIGEMTLGSSSATADGIFFVTDLVEGASRTDTDNLDVLKIALFLQSLDSDGIPTNGITIAPDAATFVPSGTITDSSLTQVAGITQSVIDALILEDPIAYADMGLVDLVDVKANLDDTVIAIAEGEITSPDAPTGSEGS